MSVLMKKNLMSIFLLIILSINWVSCRSNETGKVPVTTNSKEALKFYLKGRDLMERLRYQEAQAYFEKALNLDPDFALAHLHKGMIYFGGNDFNQELKIAVSLVDRVSPGEKLKILGMEAFANRLPMKEQEYYQTLVNEFPNDERVHVLLGNHYFFQADYNKAIGSYRRATEINPKYSPPYNQLGYSHRYLENYIEAENAFEIYIKLIPDDPNPYDSYADLLMKMGNFKKSIKTFEKALKQDPAFYSSLIGIANNLNLLGKHEQAREEIREALGTTTVPAEIRALKYTRVISFIDQGDLEGGLTELEDIFTMDKELNDPSRIAGDLIYIATVQQELGNYQEADLKYKQALQFIEDSALSNERKENFRRIYLYRYANLALAQKNIQQAKDYTQKFKQSIEGVKDRIRTWNYHELLGLIAMEEQNYDEALGELRRSNFRNPNINLQMAIAAYNKGDRTQAIKFCEKAVNFNGINNMNYAMIRMKATQFLEKLRS
jgi:tetratricopeptide (TPR) repeat protein